MHHHINGIVRRCPTTHIRRGEPLGNINRLHVIITSKEAESQQPRGASCIQCSRFDVSIVTTSLVHPHLDRQGSCLLDRGRSSHLYSMAKKDRLQCKGPEQVKGTCLLLDDFIHGKKSFVTYVSAGDSCSSWVGALSSSFFHLPAR